MNKAGSFVLFALLAFSAFAGAKNYWLSDVSVACDFSEDGSADASEVYTFNFEGGFSYAYKDFAFGNWSYSQIKVFELADGRIVSELKPEITAEGRDTRVTWRFRSKEEAEGLDELDGYYEERTFRLEYRLEKAVALYDDVGEFYWKLWGGDWEVGVNGFDAEVRFPHALLNVSNSIYCDCNASWTVNGSTLFVHSEGIQERTFLETGLSFDKSVFPNPVFARIERGTLSEKLAAEEREAARKKQAEEDWKNTVDSVKPVWLALVVLVSAASFWYFWDKHGRELRAAGTSMVREIVFDGKPWEVEWLLRQKVSVNSLTATILDLARRGHIGIKAVKKKALFFEGTDYEFTQLKGKDGLDYVEEKIVNALFGGTDGTTSLSGLRKKYSTAKSVFSSWEETASKDLDSSKFVSKCIGYDGLYGFNAVQFALLLGTLVLAVLASPFPELAWFVALAAAFVIIPFVTFSIYSSLRKKQVKLMARSEAVLALGFAFAFLCALASLLDLAVMSSVALIVIIAAFNLTVFKFVLSRFTEYGLERYNAWKGLENFFNKMNYLKEKLPSDVVLWEKYMVYSTAIGNSDRIEKEMQALDITPPHYRSMSSGRVGLASSFSSSFGSFASSSGPSRSGHGGGGHGGSGGGGGGGAG
ncbi:hypothetical protein AUJ65_04420 [Candidatus Micrarchaeota archaeon CG1_02_51_15]|nr:MAG: hypothetical protein AUJ65_04420 [Candidatus Micrarchaeota archaeon CG1_02_51_15]